MRVVRSGPPPANARFLADATGRVLLEIYCNPAVAVPDYASTSPLLLHLAFAVEDVSSAHERLVAAGAVSVDGPSRTESGDELALLRDPWGFPIQLVRRADPMP